MCHLKILISAIYYAKYEELCHLGFNNKLNALFFLFKWSNLLNFNFFSSCIIKYMIMWNHVGFVLICIFIKNIFRTILIKWLSMVSSKYLEDLSQFPIFGKCTFHEVLLSIFMSNKQLFNIIIYLLWILTSMFFMSGNNRLG